MRASVAVPRSFQAIARARVADYVEMTKPGIALTVLLTTLVGFVLASQAGLAVASLVHVLFGVALVAGGASALNQVLERDTDSLMRRTERRPLPSGRVLPGEGMAFGEATSVSYPDSDGHVDPVRVALACLERVSALGGTVRIGERVTALARLGDTIASVGVGDGRIAVGLAGRRTGFALGDAGWSDALAFLREQTGDRFEPLAQMDHVAMEMRGRQANAGAQAASPPRRRAGLDNKPDDLPANWVTSSRIVATTPRRHEWVEVRAGDSTIRTWVVYPDGTERVGAVLVLTGAPGIRDGDWELAVADQLALEGFIALVPDFATGLGPGGGHYDSFRFTDERMQAMRTRDAAERLNLLHAVREYAAKLPRSNGRTGSIGFCGGGSMSFRLATQVPEHNASVVYYGTGPSPELLAKTTAPVIGFYGEDDIRVTSTVEATRTEMQRLEKAYEAHIYPHTTHSFLWMQDLGNNFEATVDSWSRTIRFYRQHLNTPAPAGR